MRPGQSRDPVAGLLRRRRGGRRGRRRPGRRRRRAVRAAAPRLQTGFVRSYALSMLAGAVARPAGAPGGEPRMMTFPGSTHAAACCRSSVRVVVAAVPARAPRGSRKQVALGVSLRRRSSLAVAGGAASTSAAELLPVHRGRTTWIPPFGAHYALGVDGIGLTLVLLTAILTPVVHARRRGTTADDGRPAASTRFFAWILALEALIDRRRSPPPTSSCSTSFFEAMLIPVYFLIGGVRRRRGAVRRGEVPALLAARRPAHAGLGDRAVRRRRPGRRADVPARRPAPATRHRHRRADAGCSSASSSPSRSRRRCSRCTPGCRTPPRRRPPAPRCCWSASSTRSAPSG